MRILSQDTERIGLFDVPYELCVVTTGKNKKTGSPCIYVRCNLFGEYSVVAAEYSTIEKANKAMDMLKNVYYDSELSKFNNDGTTFLTTHFQFPKDNEIEV